MKDEFCLSSGLDIGWKDKRNIGEYQLLPVTDSDHRKMLIIPLSRGVKDGRLTSVIIPIFLYVEQYWEHKNVSGSVWLIWGYVRYKEKGGKIAPTSLRKRPPDEPKLGHIGVN